MLSINPVFSSLSLSEQGNSKGKTSQGNQGGNNGSSNYLTVVSTTFSADGKSVTTYSSKNQHEKSCLKRAAFLLLFAIKSEFVFGNLNAKLKWL